MLALECASCCMYFAGALGSLACVSQRVRLRLTHSQNLSAKPDITVELEMQRMCLEITTLERLGQRFKNNNHIPHGTGSGFSLNPSQMGSGLES